MEGGVFDRKMPSKYKNDPTSQQYKDHVLHTVEDYLSGNAAFVSLSGDDSIWPYGQAVRIPWTNGETIIGRVVDTGSHFRGIGKIFRAVGFEPIDVCVASSSTVVPTKVEAQIVPGDNFAKGKSVATSKFKDQTVAGLTEGRTVDDHEALARAVESELGSRPAEEQEAAAWAIRNRADGLGCTVAGALAPRGCYGPPEVSGGCASTRRAPSPTSRAVADAVLGAPPAADPTGGAVDFWVPGLQATMHLLGAAHRAAAAGGDEATARRLAGYASYGSIADVRADQARRGLGVVGVVGAVELLGRC